MAPPKQLAYSLAAVIEEHSDNALVAVPCKDGNELAIWDGVTTHRVNPSNCPRLRPSVPTLRTGWPFKRSQKGK